MALVNEWEDAMEIWNHFADDPKKKVAGRACYNMAVGCEVLGKIDLAKTWAKKSYSVFGNKKAVDYLWRLDHRPHD